jgi:hypothetical protein
MRKIVRSATEITHRQKRERKKKKENKRKMVGEEIGSSSYSLSMILNTREKKERISRRAS